MRELIAEWKRDRLWGSLCICWLAAVAASFWGSYLLPITFPMVGTLYLFRVLLPVTAVLYILWAVREKENFWKDSSALEKWCYALIVIMLLYGAVSLFRAIDFLHTFRMLFNLCFDLCFFFLMLRLCRNGTMLRRTLWVCGVMVAVQCVLGIYEVFRGGIFTDAYDSIPRFFLFTHIYQAPVVTGGNTNDYCAVLLFIFGALLVAFLNQYYKEKKSGKKLWALSLSIPVLYFLILAASASLNLVGLGLLLAGTALFFLCYDRKRLWVPLVSVLLISCIWFANQYYFIVPPIQEYLAQMEAYKQQTTLPPETSDNPETPDEPAAPGMEKPTLQIGNPDATTLEEEFYEVNAETGEKELRESGTGGVRVRLLLHAFNCFKESYGLGVGLGNTETLAPRRAVVLGWEDRPQNSIHCFVARIIADFGLFVLIPLGVIALLLLKGLFTLLFTGIRRRDGHAIGYALLFFCVLCAYPFVSTSSADAQDMIAMWIYLASVVLMSKVSQKTRMEVLV